MPTVLVLGPYRFFFYSNEYGDPAHIHVQRDSAAAKFWLDPLALARSRGFAASELNILHRLVAAHRTTFEEAWNEYFGG
ncbi:MAG: DUF4160 domain-containing protein [Pseudomonadota bacterium]|nr:DUF4160 domain-containing protein [Pseudomonadota bacterium]